MSNYNSLDELIAAIRQDIKNANQNLDLIEHNKYQSHDFFSETKTSDLKSQL
jgi:hypothetical protein